jgi:hypothetical protein
MSISNRVSDTSWSLGREDSMSVDDRGMTTRKLLALSSEYQSGCGGAAGNRRSFSCFQHMKVLDAVAGSGPKELRCASSGCSIAERRARGAYRCSLGGLLRHTQRRSLAREDVSPPAVANLRGPLSKPQLCRSR